MKAPAIVLRSTIIAALDGLLFGFDTAVISGTTTALEQVFVLSEFWLGFTVAIALVGTVAGSIIAGKPSDLFGRRKALHFLFVWKVSSMRPSNTRYDSLARLSL